MAKSLTDEYLALRNKRLGVQDDEEEKTAQAVSSSASTKNANSSTTKTTDTSNNSGADDFTRAYLERRSARTSEGFSRLTIGQKAMQDKADLPTREKEEETSWWEHANLAVAKGLSDFNKGVTSTLALLEKPAQVLFPGVATPLTDIADYYADVNEDYTKRYEASKASRGKVGQTISDVGVATVAAVPNAILALMSGGSSVAAQGAALGSKTASLASTVGTAVKEMVKNPMYWSSVVQTLGTDYEEAKNNGANDLEAAATAIISSALNAGVEIGGGLEVLPSRLKSEGSSAVYQWVKGAVEEGKEEVVQGVISGITQKGIYDENKAMFSTEDQEAVFNPMRMAEEGLMGMAVGGILGGGQIGVASAANAAVNNANNRRMGNIGADYQVAAEEVVAEGLTFAPGTEAYKSAQSLKAKMDAGETLTDTELGWQVYQNERAIQQEERFAEVNSEAPAELAEAAREVVAKEMNLPQTENNVVTEATAEPVSYRNVLNTNRQAVKRVDPGYGVKGTEVFNSIVESNEAEPGKVRMEFQSAYEAGLTDLPRDRVQLQTSIQEEAYNAGRMDSILQKKEAPAGATVWGKESGFIRSDASQDLDAQTAATFQAMAKSLGTKIMMEEQVYGGRANGSYNDGVVRIAKDAENPYMVVAKHEITHHLQKAAPKQYTDFRNYAVQLTSAERSMTGTTLVEDYQDRAARQGVTLTTEQAMDEIAADFTERILTDEKALHDFVTHSKADAKRRTVAQKFFDAVRNFINKVKSAFKGDKAKMDAAAKEQFGATVAQLEKAEKLWKEAYKAAERTAEENGAAKREGNLFRTTDEDGTSVLTTSVDNPVMMTTEDGNAQLSLKTYKAFGRAELKRWLDIRVSKKQLTEADAQDIVRQLDEYYDLCQKFKDKYAPFGAWSDASVVTDNKGKPVFSVVKANGEYAMNLDFSLVCKKRRTLDAVFKEMIDRGIMDNLSLEEADIAKVNEIIRESGFETACALCFVDSKRYRQAKVADTFVSQYNDIVKLLIPEDGSAKPHYFDFVGTGLRKADGVGLHTLSNAQLQSGIEELKRVMRENGSKTVAHKIAKHLLNTPKDRRFVSRSDFMNTDGFGAVKLKNPAILKLYNSSKGAGGPKAAFSDVQYLGEILKKNNFTPTRAYAVGGVRIQSFSDYIPRLVFDYLQMVADLSAKKLPAHAYTKEAIFVKQFGMTGIKMNMSLVPAVAEDGIAPGLDKNGDYFWFDGQSFGSDVKVKGSGKTGFDLAIQIQNAPGYSQHCGTIAVGVSNEHIMKMLDDENIRMIIPYHKSSLNHIVAVMNNIDKYTDYTKVQNTRKADGTKISGKDFNYNEALLRTGDAKAAAAEYLAWCEEHNYIPKFDDFAQHENYYKVLEDFSTYDNGVAAPQGAVTLTLPKEGDAFGSMVSLIEEGLEEDALLESSREKSVPAIVDKVEQALEKRTQFSLKSAEAPIAQEISSAKTSIKQIPALFKDKNAVFGKTNIDIGGGKFDLAKNYLAERGTKSMIFDPYNRGAQENSETLKFLQSGKKADTATCANVLNVIAEPAARSNVILETAKAVKANGTAYFMVYEGDGSGEGRQTSSGWQNNRKTADYVGEISKWFESVQRKGKLIIAKNPKANLPKAAWEIQPGEAVMYSLKDSDYMDAVNKGDMATVQKMVDEKAKRAGFDVLDLYHGTSAFGFTKVDSSAARDGISFFATTRPEVAAGYVYGNADVREIGDRRNQMPTVSKHAPIKDILSALKSVDNSYENARVATEKDKQKAADRSLSKVLPAAKDLRMYAIPENVDDYVRDLVYAIEYGDYQKIAELAKKRKTLPREIEYNGNTFVQASNILDDIKHQMRSVDRALNSEDAAAIETSRGLAIVPTEDLVYAYDAATKGANSGIYRLYASSENQFVINGNGANWNSIPVPKSARTGSLEGKATASTRDIAAWAKANGYNSVRFNDIYDAGAYGTDEISDVFAFFTDNDNLVKSADPVTYDDNGKAIPLSKRFDKKSEDIRYSMKNSEGTKLTKEQQGFFKDSKVRDENGNLMVMYHGTQGGGFTTFDPEYSDDSTSLFFTSSLHNAASYSGTYDIWKEGAEADTPANYGVYLNLTNPLIILADDANFDLIKFYTPEMQEMEKRAGELSSYGFSLPEGDPKRADAFAESDALYDELDEMDPWHGDRVDTRRASKWAKENGYDGVIFKDLVDYAGMMEVPVESATVAVAFSADQVKSISNKKPSGDKDIRYSLKDDYAPTFYSHMERVVSDVKQEKLGASSVVPMLRGKGVKAEEIKWSGIEEWLSGKKSVTKAELLDFIRANSLEIAEETRGGDALNEFMLEWMKLMDYDSSFENVVVDDKFIADAEEFLQSAVDEGNLEQEEMDRLVDLAKKVERGRKASRWDSYKLDGGSDYREYIYKMPGSDYTNNAMRVHWGSETGVLAHARVQDIENSFTGWRTLFIEEIQSDWHNEGHKAGYQERSGMTLRTPEGFLRNDRGVLEYLDHLGIEYTESGGRVRIPAFDSSFHDGRHEYTTRFNGDYVEVARELEQRYVGRESTLTKAKVPDAPFRDTYHEFVLKSLLRMAAEGDYDSIGWTPADIQSARWDETYREGYRIEYDQEIPKFLNKYGKKWGAKVEKSKLEDGTAIWNMDITDDMKRSVLHAGQPMYSLKGQSDLLKENAKLKETVEGLKEQFKTTKFAKVDRKSLDSFAKKLLKDYSSGADINETRDALDELYTYIANGENGEAAVWDEAYKRAYETAVGILENSSELNDDMYQEYKHLRQRLKNYGITINPEYDHDIPGYGSINEFRKAHFGKLKIVKNGTPVDVVYQDLANTYPELFDEYEYTTQPDQLAHISEVLADMQPVEVNRYEHNMREHATWLANDIMERFYELPQAKPTFADKAEQRLTKQVIRDTKKLERVRLQKNERIKKLIESNREKIKEVRETERAKRAEAIKDIKEHYKAKEGKASEGRKAREMRAKILRHTTDLSKKLLRASDKNHIPQELQGPVAKLLECINMESNYTYDATTDSYKKNDLGTPTLRTRLFANLRKIYANLANELTIDPDLLGEDGLLTDVVELADKRMADMTYSELETIWKAIRAIEASIQSANIAFNQQRYATISEWAEALRMDNFSKKEKVELDGPFGILGKAQKLTGIDMMTPEAYFHRLGATGDGLFRMMRDAQDDHIRKMKEVTDFTHKALKGVNVNKLESKMHTVTLGGQRVRLSTAQIMELYVLLNREQAREHIMVGGILPDVVSKGGLKKVSKAKPVRGVQMSELLEVFRLLTPEQIKAAETLQEYASTQLSKWGNEAAMKVYNYEKFGEKAYWPIRVNKQETNSSVQKDTQVTSVAGRGFTKGTKPHANNSVMIGSIFDTFSTHASEMATYAAWLAPMEDINRIRNFTFKSAGQTVDTVKGIIDTVHGKQGTAYLGKLMADLSNGVKGTHGETAYMSALVGNYKAASVGANLRVIIQQPTAILRAMDMLGPQYLVAGMRPANGWKKAKKYAPIAQWKDWGYFDINTGRQMKDVMFDSDSALNKVRNAAMAGAGFADSLSWGLLWNGVETEIKHKRKDLNPGTEEFYKAVAERFNEIVDHTQVVDGILQRSQIMRSADGLTKMATSFMGEPTKQYNMMMGAVYDATHGSKEHRRSGKKHLARAAFALAVSGVANAMAQSIMDAVRDDDKEREYWEKWLSALTGLTGEEETAWDKVKNFALEGNLGSTLNPAAYIPFVKDVLSLLQGYDVSRMDMESVEKTLTAGQNMIKALNGEGKFTIGSASASLFAEVARLLGIPVANLKREVKSFAMLAAVETDNYLMQYRMEKASLELNYAGNASTFVDILFNAYQNDREAYELIYEDMIASGFDKDKLQSGMEARLKEAAGVTSVSDLETRYLHPDQEPEYNSAMSAIRSSSLWRGATEEQRDKVEEKLYGLVTDSKSSEELQEKIDDGKNFGLDQTEYLLYTLALDMVDRPNSKGEYGGAPTASEKWEAIGLTGLDDGEIAYLWDTDQALEAYSYGVDMEAYAQFKSVANDFKGENKQKEIMAYLNEICPDEATYLYLMGTEYSSWKKRADYKGYFGK